MADDPRPPLVDYRSRHAIDRPRPSDELRRFAARCSGVPALIGAGFAILCLVAGGRIDRLFGWMLLCWPAAWCLSILTIWWGVDARGSRRAADSIFFILSLALLPFMIMAAVFGAMRSFDSN